MSAAINPAPPQPAASASASGAGHAAGSGAQGAAAPPVLGVFETLLASLGAGEDAAAPGDPAATAGKTGGKAAAGGKAAPDAGKAKDKTDADGKTTSGDAAAPAATATPDALGLLAPVLPTTLANTPPVAGSAASDGAGGPAQAVSAALAADKDPGATAAAVHAAQLAARTEPDLKDAEDKTPLGALVSAAARAANGSAANAAGNVPADAGTQSKPAADLAPQGSTPPTAATAQTPQPLQAGLPATNPAAPTVADAATPDLPVLAAVVSAQAAAAPQDPAAQPPAPTAAKDKGPAPKAAVRVEGAQSNAAPTGVAALTAKAADALQPTPGGAASPHAGDDEPPPEATADAHAETPASPVQGPADPSAATAAVTTPAALIHAAAVAVRGAPQTVAALAAQIVKKLDGRASQFDVQLDPAGLGKVDVRIAIGADGRMSAAMSFDTPQAAAELRARAGELHQAMEQAGFDLSGGMTFDVAGDRGQGGQAQNQQPDSGAAFRGRAFQAALDNTADVAPVSQLSLRRTSASGVDIRI